MIVKSTSMRFTENIQTWCSWHSSERVIVIIWLDITLLVSDSIEAAAENDLFNKEQAYDKLRFDENGEEIIY